MAAVAAVPHKTRSFVEAICISDSSGDRISVTLSSVVSVPKMDCNKLTALDWVGVRRGVEMVSGVDVVWGGGSIVPKMRITWVDLGDEVGVRILFPEAVGEAVRVALGAGVPVDN